ncbi:transcriptional regulator [Pelistega indica]|uniref:Transcriptional regulator n=1 Tax=Pelistega indica TaxID=1414851 RepID=V8FRZ6_9BURK|nr:MULTISPECIES: FCD domain-containing protein [Pelistega]ETD66935.1 transcriptional regulator [Pelistega indica]
MAVSNPLTQVLADFIESQSIQIGERLPAERKLCEILSISRTRLRELFKQLIAQDLLETRVGSGTYLKQSPTMWRIDSNLNQLSKLVSEDPNYRFDVQEARAVLEGGTAWYASLRATAEEKREIRQAYEQLLEYQQQGNLILASDADANFHLVIAEASHNAVLIQLMRNVFELLHHNVVLARHKMYSDAEMVDNLNEQHKELVEAIEKGDAQNALNIVQGHIHYVIDKVKEINESEARRERTSRLKKF